MTMTTTAKKLKKELLKAGFTFNKFDNTFYRVKPFTGLSSKIYCYNHRVDLCTGTLNSSWWEDGYNTLVKMWEGWEQLESLTAQDILNVCLDN